MTDLVHLERPAPAVAAIRLDNPPMNVLNSQLSAELGEIAAAIAADDTIRAVVVHGSDKAFAAGADVKEFEHLDHAVLLRQGLRAERSIAAIAHLPKPVIAAVTGVALGGGCELALAADFRVSADNARWGQPEILLGIIPGAGGTQRLPRLVGPAVAKDIIFSGRFVKADEALRIGLVDRVVPADEVVATALEMAGSYAERPSTALAVAKAAVDRGLDVDLETGLQIEAGLFASLFATADKEIGVRSFIQHGPGKATFPTPGE